MTPYLAFLENGIYDPKPSKPRFQMLWMWESSNFIRIRKCIIWLAQFSQDFSSFTFTDDETLCSHETIYAANIAEPHGAVGYLGLKSAKPY
jgi:hypothetical protein